MLITLAPALPSRSVADIVWTHGRVPLYFFHSMKAGHPRMQNEELYPPQFQHWHLLIDKTLYTYFYIFAGQD